MLAQSVDLVEHDDQIDFIVGLAATIGQAHVLLHGVAARFLVWLQVVHLLIKESLTLRRIADADQRHAAQRVLEKVAVCNGLLHASINTAHHFASDHADLVKNEKLRVREVRLELGQMLVVCNVCKERWIKPMYETVDRRRVKANIEGGRTCRSSDAYKILEQTFILQLLQSCFQRQSLACACGTQEQQT